MKEYKYVKIADQSSDDDTCLENFIDKLPEEERRFLYSATLHGGILTLVWNGSTPKKWKERNSIDVELPSGSKHWEIFREEQNYQLPDSLKRCLILLRKYKSGEIGDRSEHDFSVCTPDNMRTLELKGLIELETNLSLKNAETFIQGAQQIQCLQKNLDFEITDEGQRIELNE